MREFPPLRDRCASRPGRCRLSGWLGLPTRARAQPDLQFWFVNGRAVRDRLLGNAVRLGYRDVLYHGRHPGYVLYLTLDPRHVDVNAHPAKLELRFRDSRPVHDVVFRAIERELADTKPDWGERAGRHPGAAGRATSRRHRPAGLGARADAAAAVRAQPRPVGVGRPQAPLVRSAPAGAADSHSACRSRSCTGSTSWPRIAEGLMLIDMHAAPRARAVRAAQVANGRARLASQQLLEPLVIAVKAHELEALLEERPHWEAAGFELDALGPTRLRCAACRRC